MKENPLDERLIICQVMENQTETINHLALVKFVSSVQNAIDGMKLIPTTNQRTNAHAVEYTFD